MTAAAQTPQCQYCQGESKSLLRPPVDAEKNRAWTKEQVQTVADRLIKANNLKFTVRLFDTEAWEHYLNHHHFVPPTAEGRSIDFKFNGNWHEDYANDPRQMVYAEITETGEFYLWWEAANYFSMSRAQFEGGLKFAIQHEAVHYNQWRQLATEVLVALGHGEADELMPQTIRIEELPTHLADLEHYPAAKEAFLRIWNDVGHYQCRELVAHWLTSKDLDFATAFPNAPGILPQLQQWLDFMKIYRDGKPETSPGCKNSVWAAGFASDIANADQLIRRLEKLLRELNLGK